MTEHNEEDVVWKSLPPLEGGVWAAMVTEVLDKSEIPNLVKTDLEGGGLGVVTGTEALGRGWKIFVPEEDFARALEIYESILGGESPEGHGVGEEPERTE